MQRFIFPYLLHFSDILLSDTCYILIWRFTLFSERIKTIVLSTTYPFIVFEITMTLVRPLKL